MKLHIEVTIKVEKKEELSTVMFTDSARKKCLAPFMYTLKTGLEEELSTVTVEHHLGGLRLTAVKETEYLEHWGPAKLLQEFELLQEEVEDAIEDNRGHLKFHDLKEVTMTSRTVV